MTTRQTPTPTSKALYDRVLSNLAFLHAAFDKYGVSNPRLFGSVVLGTADGQSDIDIIVENIQAQGLLAYSALVNELEDILGAKVDLVIEGSIKANRRKYIPGDLVVKL
jgi:predicted nucleotidyltransferase